jgi:hypothetical protein
MNSDIKKIYILKADLSILESTSSCHFFRFMLACISLVHAVVLYLPQAQFAIVISP